MATDDLKPVYLILSGERLLLDQAVNKLKKRVSEVADLSMNSEVFDAENLDADAVIAAANTLPFMSDHRLVLVNNVEKVNSAASEALINYIADPSPTTVLALVGEKLAKNTRLYKAVDKIGGVVERKAPTRTELPRKVQSMFADRGKTIAEDVAERFISAVGRDLQQIAGEIDKAVAFVGKDVAEITRAHVDEIAAHTAKRSVFDFSEAVAERDCRRALAIAGELIDDGTSEYALLAMALRTVRDLIAAQSIMARGGGIPDLMRELGRPDWQVKRLPRQQRDFGRGELVDLLRDAAETDAQMKTGRDSRLVLELWIMKACGAV